MTMNSKTPRREVILAAVDHTDLRLMIVQEAAALAQGRPNAELHVLHVLEWVPSEANAPVTPSMTDVLEETRKMLERACEQAAEVFAGPVFAHVAAGVAWRETVQLAESLGATLVVVGTRDMSATKPSCPVFVVRQKSAEMVPEIEPVCPDCAAHRVATKGAELWCERHHQKRHVHGRLHYQLPPGFGSGSMLVHASTNSHL
jgi:nucleotide-binding universal stress UspA family protein